MTSVSGFSFRGKHVFLRPVEPEDLETLYAWENDPEIWHVSNTLTPFSKDVLRSYLLNAHRDILETRQFRFIIILQEMGLDRSSSEQPGVPIGTIDLFDYDPHHSRAGIGILIKDPDQRRKGYASEALEILCRYGFEILLLHQLYCNITSGNVASLKLFRNHGFDIAGTKREWNKTAGGWEDEILLQKINRDHLPN
ncbi:MAG: GNAT family N-acetyltransferase [Chlorobi bacterium]|nr:GNAT family N-acetyltransferase [Chlorobiota bacterium]